MYESKIMPEHYSYAKYIKELLTLCNKHKIKFKIIGYEKYEKIDMSYPIYHIIINPNAKIDFCICAGVQAYEIAGPLTILHLLQTPQKYFNRKIRYHIFPLINPTSFDLRQRFDDDNRDLNTITKQTLKSKNYREVQAFIRDIGKKYSDAFLSLHEDNDERRFYAYVFEKAIEPVYRKIINQIGKHNKILDQKLIYGDKSQAEGLIINEHDRSFEDYLFTHKQAGISICTETPGKLALNKRISMNTQVIMLLTKFLLK